MAKNSEDLDLKNSTLKRLETDRQARAEEAKKHAEAAKMHAQIIRDQQSEAARARERYEKMEGDLTAKIKELKSERDAMKESCDEAKHETMKAVELIHILNSETIPRLHEQHAKETADAKRRSGLEIASLKSDLESLRAKDGRWRRMLSSWAARRRSWSGRRRR